MVENTAVVTISVGVSEVLIETPENFNELSVTSVTYISIADSEIFIQPDRSESCGINNVWSSVIVDVQLESQNDASSLLYNTVSDIDNADCHSQKGSKLSWASENSELSSHIENLEDKNELLVTSAVYISFDESELLIEPVCNGVCSVNQYGYTSILDAQIHFQNDSCSKQFNSQYLNGLKTSHCASHNMKIPIQAGELFCNEQRIVEVNSLEAAVDVQTHYQNDSSRSQSDAQIHFQNDSCSKQFNSQYLNGLKTSHCASHNMKNPIQAGELFCNEQRIVEVNSLEAAVDVQTHSQNDSFTSQSDIVNQDVKVSRWASKYSDKPKEVAKSIVSTVCCVKNCQSTNVTAKMREFPSIFRMFKGKKVLNRAGLERCREWVRLAGNMSLLNVNPAHLNNAYHMCFIHFDLNQFNTKNSSTLKRSALPSLFGCNPISDDLMSVYDIGWNIRECNEDSFVDYIQKNIIDITEEEEMRTEAANDNALSIDNDFECKSTERVKRCCVRGCTNICDKLYPFPNLYKKNSSVINLKSLQKCREWLRKCGNPILLNCNPSKLFEEAFVCKVHFTEDCFYKSNRSTLKVASIPSLFKCSSLSDEVMHKFDMEWKIGQILSSTIEAFDEVDEKIVASEDDLVVGTVDQNEVNPCNVHSNIQNNSKLQRCCYSKCKNSNRTSKLFKFPNVLRKVKGVRQVDENIMERFFTWLKNAGNEELLLYDPKSVNENYFVCKDHFGAEWLDDRNSGKLKPLAIPYCSDHSLLEEALQQYNMKVQRWKDNNYGPLCFDVSKKAAIDFESEMKNLKWNECGACKEKHLVKGSNESTCSHRDKCWEYCGLNNMDPGDVPPELQDLTFIEERLIARVHPVISVYMLTRNGQYGYRKNVINFAQKIEHFVRELPMKISELNSVLIVRKEGADNSYHDFNVRGAKVRAALIWLKANNKYYEDIEICEDNLNLLPENSNVSDDIPSLPVDGIQKDVGNKLESDGVAIEEAEEDVVLDEPYSTGISDVLFPHQDQQIKKYLKWPAVESQPIDEYSTPGYIACAFPSLFCNGAADLRDWHEKDVQCSNYFRHLLRYRDGRFAKHKTFRFFAYNSWMRWTALTDGNVFVKQNQEFNNMTVDQLKELLNENPNMLRKVMFHAKNLRGSKAYWHTRCGELHDMMNQLRMPTIFLTLSAADLHWEDLYRLLTGMDDLSNLPEYERHKLLRDNPQIVDEFFDMRVNAFLNHVLLKKYKVVDYWYRIEYQHRGSPHLHGVFWFEDAPNCENIENASEEEVEVIVDYFKDLITAINPDSHAEINEDHPCRRRYQNVTDFQKDLAQLLNTVQRHTRCSPDYCVRYNKKSKENKCRFGFPILDFNEEARCQCKESGEVEFCPARNDDRLNKYNQFIIQLWRANMDIAPVLSKKRLLAYLSKYISKSEISSMCFHELMSTIMERMHGDGKCVRAIQSFLIKACVERDISAQEVCHILLGLKLHSSGTRSFVIINFNNKKWSRVVDKIENESDSSGGKSFIEKYKDRPADVVSESLWDVARKYNIATWKELPKRKYNIVRVFPKLKSKVDDDNDPYFEQQVYLHVPWRDEDSLKLEDETWRECYLRHGVDKVPAATDLLENVICDDLEDEDEDELVCNFYEGEVGTETPLEWMICSDSGHGRINKVELGKRDVDIKYPWMNSYELYEQYGTIEEFRQFIQNKKKESEMNGEPSSINVADDGPVVALSQDQQKVLNLVHQQIESIEINGMHETFGGVPKTCIVQGKAGTGKSLVIREIRRQLQQKFGDDSYVLGTPTGVSALLINGKTVHSIFRLPRLSKNFKPLTGQAARKLCNDFANVKFLILDEYSMIGSRLWGFLNARCKEATGNHHEDFGGLFTYCFGDIKQLPPVQDRPIYSYNQKSSYSRSGFNVMKRIQSCIILNKIHRQSDNQFLDILNNVSEGLSTKDDFEVLRNRMKGTAKDADMFDDAL